MKNRRGLLPIFFGLLLIAAALFLGFYNLFDAERAGASAQSALKELEEHLPETSVSTPVYRPEYPYEFPTVETDLPDYMLNPEIEMPEQSVDGVDYIGILTIPTLELRLPIASDWSEALLRETPCRYAGSAYLDDLIICGHNYASHFGGLGNLHFGDEVIFTDIDGNEFHYEVAELETLQSTAIEQMKSGDWDLTLFTCTWGGKSRVTVRCIRASS